MTCRPSSCSRMRVTLGGSHLSLAEKGSDHAQLHLHKSSTVARYEGELESSRQGRQGRQGRQLRKCLTWQGRAQRRQCDITVAFGTSRSWACGSDGRIRFGV